MQTRRKNGHYKDVVCRDVNKIFRVKNALTEHEPGQRPEHYCQEQYKEKNKDKDKNEDFAAKEKDQNQYQNQDLWNKD